jgi:Cysteine rich repeat
MCYSGWKSLPEEQRNTMRKLILVVTLLSLSVSTGAIAQQQQRSGTPEEQKACARDVQKHCRSVMNEPDLTVLACLQENRSKLTPACNQVLVSHGQ